MRILWPTCKKVSEEQGLGLAGAKAAFAYHVFQDPAWRSRYEFRELEAFIEGLK